MPVKPAVGEVARCCGLGAGAESPSMSSRLPPEGGTEIGEEGDCGAAEGCEPKMSAKRSILLPA